MQKLLIAVVLVLSLGGCSMLNMFSETKPDSGISRAEMSAEAMVKATEKAEGVIVALGDATGVRVNPETATKWESRASGVEKGVKVLQNIAPYFPGGQVAVPILGFLGILAGGVSQFLKRRKATAALVSVLKTGDKVPGFSEKVSAGAVADGVGDLVEKTYQADIAPLKGR